MPSQVLASLISTRSRDTPSFSYRPIRRRALSIDFSVSNESRASTSVETRPATCLRMRTPNCTKSASIAAPMSPRASWMALSTSGW